jgi:hypothetical protein
VIRGHTTTLRLKGGSAALGQQKHWELNMLNTCQHAIIEPMCAMCGSSCSIMLNNERSCARSLVLLSGPSLGMLQAEPMVSSMLNSMHELTHTSHMGTHCLWDQGECFVIYNKDTALLTEYSDQRV